MYPKESLDIIAKMMNDTRNEEAGYISVEKTFQGKRPRTVCRMTATGREAFMEYVEALKEYVAPYISADSRSSQNLTGGLLSCDIL